jgi:hypothetical protein
MRPAKVLYEQTEESLHDAQVISCSLADLDDAAAAAAAEMVRF